MTEPSNTALSYTPEDARLACLPAELLNGQKIGPVPLLDSPEVTALEATDAGGEGHAKRTLTFQT